MAITTDTLSYHVPTGQQAYKSTKLVNNCCVPVHAVEKKFSEFRFMLHTNMENTEVVAILGIAL